MKDNVEDAWQLIANERLLSSFLEASEIGCCVQVAKRFECLSKQFHGFSTPTVGSCQAFLQGQFLTWPKLTLFYQEHFEHFVEMMNSLFWANNSLYPDYQVLDINSDSFTESSEPLSTYDSARQSHNSLLSALFCYTSDLPKLHTIRFNCLGCWATRIEFFAGALEHPQVKILCIDSLNPDSEALDHFIGYIVAGHNVVPNLEKICLTCQECECNYAPFAEVFEVPGVFPFLRSLTINYVDIPFVNTLARAGHSCLENVDLHIFEYHEKKIRIQWKHLFSSLTNLRELRLKIVLCSQLYKTQLHEELMNLPLNVKKCDIVIYGSSFGLQGVGDDDFGFDLADRIRKKHSGRSFRLVVKDLKT